MAKIVSGAHEGGQLIWQRRTRMILKTTQNWTQTVTDVSDQVVGYYVADEAHRVSAGVGAAAAGAILLGPIGLAGGLLAAKKKRLGVVTWRDGTQSVVEIKDKHDHETLVKLAVSNGVS